MADPMKIRAKLGDGGIVDVRALISHEMETGQRKDASGKTVPAWHITEMVCKLNGKDVINVQWGPSISKNPFFGFKVAGANKGDKLSLEWVDNKGEKRLDEVTIA